MTRASEAPDKVTAMGSARSQFPKLDRILRHDATEFVAQLNTLIGLSRSIFDYLRFLVKRDRIGKHFPNA
jgi:hypothetical protein